MKIKNRLSEWLAIYERELNTHISREDLARQVGISRPTLAKYLRNDVDQYDIKVVLKLMRFFGKSSFDEFFIKDEKEGNSVTNHHPQDAVA